MKVEVDHVHHNPMGRTVYVRIVDPTPLRRAMVVGAVRCGLGLTLVDDNPHMLPESMTFSTVDYAGEDRLEDLDVESFNRMVEDHRPLKDIKKAGVFEVQAVVAWLVSDDQCADLAGDLGNGVHGVQGHPYIGPWALALTVLGMDDGPNVELVQQIGVDLCNKLTDWAVEP